MIPPKKLIAICFDQDNKAYKYRYKLFENSKSLNSFERFCIARKYKYINYYDKETGVFIKRRYLWLRLKILLIRSTITSQNAIKNSITRNAAIQKNKPKKTALIRITI